MRGLNSSKIDIVLDELTIVFKLDEFNNKLVQDLSGGNKRKVSSSISSFSLALKTNFWAVFEAVAEIFFFCKDKQHETLFYQIEAPEMLTNEAKDHEAVLQSIVELFAIISNKTIGDLGIENKF